MINKKKLDEEEKMEFIWEQCEKDPLVKKAISKAIKKQWIEEEFFQKMDLVKRLVSVERLVSVMMLTSSVSDIEAKHYFKDPEYNEIYKKVKKSFLSNTIDSKLIMLYNRNRSPVIKRINYFIRKYERKIYGKKYSEIQTLKKSDRSDKDEIIQSIKKSYFNDPLYEKIISLEYEKEQLRKFPYSTEDIKSPIPLSGDPLFLQKYYSLKIFKPELFVNLYQYEKKYDKFPFKWLRHLTVPQYRYIYERFKKGTLGEDFILYAGCPTNKL